MASLSRTESLRILSAAADSGISHFDVAPSYGYGEAEGVLGEFLQGRRSNFTITTKFGIAPPNRRLASGFVKDTARAVARVLPGLRPLMRRGASGLVAAPQFDVPSARKSLEQSLRLLRTDVIDIFLMHECKVEDLRSDELMRFLEDALVSGKIRCFGIATDRKTVSQALDSSISFGKVAQFPDGVTMQNSVLPVCFGKVGAITHSALSSSLEWAATALENQPARLKSLSETTGADLSNKEKLAGFLLAMAMSRNPDGCVIYSSRSPQRARSTADLALIDLSSMKMTDFSDLAT